MKKIIITTMVALLLATSSFAGIVITVTLEMGRKNHDCTGFGICSAKVQVSYEEGFINGTLDVNEERGSMIIGINEKDILKVNPDKIVYFKGKNTVIFTEDFSMPPAINVATKSKKPLIIKKGVYPLTYKKGYYFIEIPL